jgi:hypothetical protein
MAIPLQGIFSLSPFILGVLCRESLKGPEKFHKPPRDRQKQEDNEQPGLRAQFLVQKAPQEETDENGSCHEETEASEQGKSLVGFSEAIPSQNRPSRTSFCPSTFFVLPKITVEFEGAGSGGPAKM